MTFTQSSNYIRPLEANRKADVAPGDSEFDTPGLDDYTLYILKSGNGPPVFVLLCEDCFGYSGSPAFQYEFSELVSFSKRAARSW